jgi:alkyl hydroperoxide reductase subunit AhpC
MVQGLRLGSIAPDFEAETTAGTIKFHEWLDNSWAVIFSHPGERSWVLLSYPLESYALPGDFTPVCTTELGEVARRAPEFKKRGVK